MDIRTKEAVRYLGYGKNAVDDKTLQEIQDSFRELERLADKKSIYRIFELSLKDENELKIGNVEIYSRNLRTNLKDCKQVVLFAATLGTEVDRLIRKMQVVDMAKAVVMQACAATLLEEYCDELQQKIAEHMQEQGKYIRPRFSPGYGDFSIQHQKAVLAMLEASKRIGVTMTDSYMLTPTKSVTAVIGISDTQTECKSNTCEECDKTDCTYRRS
jgi:hypothetical protein